SCPIYGIGENGNLHNKSDNRRVARWYASDGVGIALSKPCRKVDHHCRNTGVFQLWYCVQSYCSQQHQTGSKLEKWLLHWRRPSLEGVGIGTQGRNGYLSDSESFPEAF